MAVTIKSRASGITGIGKAAPAGGDIRSVVYAGEAGQAMVRSGNQIINTAVSTTTAAIKFFDDSLTTAEFNDQYYRLGNEMALGAFTEAEKNITDLGWGNKSLDGVAKSSLPDKSNPGSWAAHSSALVKDGLAQIELSGEYSQKVINKYKALVFYPQMRELATKANKRQREARVVTLAISEAEGVRVTQNRILSSTNIKDIDQAYIGQLNRLKDGGILPAKFYASSIEEINNIAIYQKAKVLALNEVDKQLDPNDPNGVSIEELNGAIEWLLGVNEQGVHNAPDLVAKGDYGRDNLVKELTTLRDFMVNRKKNNDAINQDIAYKAYVKMYKDGRMTPAARMESQLAIKEKNIIDAYFRKEADIEEAGVLAEIIQEITNQTRVSNSELARTIVSNPATAKQDIFANYPYIPWEGQKVIRAWVDVANKDLKIALAIPSVIQVAREEFSSTEQGFIGVGLNFLKAATTRKDKVDRFTTLLLEELGKSENEKGERVSVSMENQLDPDHEDYIVPKIYKRVNEFFKVTNPVEDGRQNHLKDIRSKLDENRYNQWGALALTSYLKKEFTESMGGVIQSEDILNDIKKLYTFVGKSLPLYEDTKQQTDYISFLEAGMQKLEITHYTRTIRPEIIEAFAVTLNLISKNKPPHAATSKEIKDANQSGMEAWEKRMEIVGIIKGN